MLKHEGTINITQLDWRKRMQERCIQEVTNDLVENQMELEYEESDQEIEEIEVMDNFKLVDVIHKFEQIKAMAITSTNRFVEIYYYIYHKVQEMSISGRIQTSMDKYFKWVFIISVLT